MCRVCMLNARDKQAWHLREPVHAIFSKEIAHILMLCMCVFCYVCCVRFFFFLLLSIYLPI